MLNHLCPYRAGLLHDFEESAVVAWGLWGALSSQVVVVFQVDHFLCLTSEDLPHVTAFTIEKPGPTLRVFKALPDADTPGTWAPV